MEQGQLFDTGPYTRPPTHSESMTAPAENVRTPAQRKIDSNRERIAGTSPGTRDRYAFEFGETDSPDPDVAYNTHVSHWDFPVRGAAAHLAKLTPFDDPTFHRYGKVREMPLHGNGTIDEGGYGVGQSHVNMGRVQELAADPSKGVDVRFPAGYDLPFVAPVNFRRNGRTISAPVVHNGTHRVMAAIERGELFTPVREIPKESMGDAVADAHERANRFAVTRDMRQQLSSGRMVYHDPTATFDMSEHRGRRWQQ